MGTCSTILRELWSERRRISLVALGVFWGTLSLAFLLTFSNEFVRATSGTIANFGVGLLRFSSGSTTLPHGGLPAGRPIRLFPEDADALRAALPEVRDACVEYTSGLGNTLRFGDQQLNATICGVEPAFGGLRDQRPCDGGRFLNTSDEAERRRVIFLGNRIARRLFGSRPPVGESVELAGVPLLVVGVQQPKITIANYNGDEQDKATMPASTFRELFDRRAVSYVWVGLRDGSNRERATAGVYRVLGARHGFDPEDSDALDLFDSIEISEWIHEVLEGNRLFTAIVGLFGLLVSVVGVGNVMFALVEERRLEIGVQMAIGARPRQIAMERLVEGLAVTLIGGVLGLAACAGLLALLDMLPMPDEVLAYLGHPRLSWPVGLGIVAILCTAGALAGWFPARRAAALDPMAILREE